MNFSFSNWRITTYCNRKKEVTERKVHTPDIKFDVVPPVQMYFDSIVHVEEQPQMQAILSYLVLIYQFLNVVIAYLSPFYNKKNYNTKINWLIESESYGVHLQKNSHFEMREDSC